MAIRDRGRGAKAPDGLNTRLGPATASLGAPSGASRRGAPAAITICVIVAGASSSRSPAPGIRST
eukprot:4027997-Alexandrium_andersonii.AAC.1